MPHTSGNGDVGDPWVTDAWALGPQYSSYAAPAADPAALVVAAGDAHFDYLLRAIDDLHAMLVAHGGWVALGAAAENQPPPVGSVEAWARSATNPIGGWYGLTEGQRGRFAAFVPPILEHQGKARITLNQHGNRMRAL
jgi:hypothetical protein